MSQEAIAAQNTAPSEADLRAALERDKENPELYLALAQLLHSQSRWQEAEQLSRQAIALAPQMMRAYAGLSASLSQQQRYDEAAEALESALSTHPGQPMLWYNLAGVRSLQKQFTKSEEAIARAIALQPQRADFYRQFAAICLAQGKKIQAINQCRAALRIAPDNQQWWKDLFLLWMQVPIVPPDNFLEDDLLKMLTFDGAYPKNIGSSIQRLLYEKPIFTATIQTIRQGKALDLADSAVKQVLMNALFLTFLAKERISQPGFEFLLRGLRKAVLMRAAEGPLEATLLPFLCAMADQCFLSEYVYPESAEETDALNTLLAQKKLSREALMLVASYRPLHSLENAAALLEREDLTVNGAVRAVLTQQIAEPLEELKIRETIPVLTPINDAISRAVQAQYEENPYPRWKQHLTMRPLLFKQYMEMLFPYLKAEDHAYPERPRILVAGCGTGKQPIETVCRIANTQVTAFDISRTSLSYAIRKQRELGITNIEFGQGDIMELKAWDKRFDIVICSGVLHHMADPIAGWRKLLSCLAEDGVIKIALYSEHARRHIVAAREFIAKEGFPATTEGIRACRDAIFALPEKHPARLCAHSVDFYTLSSCRDLIFHVQEHRFTIPQIKDILEELGLEFLGFDFPTFQQVEEYRRKFPDDPRATSLDNWHKHEMETPYLFASMYQFAARRKSI